MTANIAARLLQHYVDKSRVLPWRSAPGEAAPDPYRVWLSEIMLQQTTVATVSPRFERFVARWPDVASLAAADEASVMGEWAGLGYYARARNLIACARAVAAIGAFPATADGLRKLPGIGAYTAAAIAAIAFREDAAPVDTNVERGIARLGAIAVPDRRDIERRFLAIAPPGRAGDLAQAMMDLGATICRPRAPKCGLCPVARDCAAFATGNPQAFPTPKMRRLRPHKFGTAWWIERDGQLWLVRRPATGLLGGMAALPGGEWGDEQPDTSRAFGTVRHVFTHFTLDLAIERRDQPLEEGWWQPIDRIEEAGLPTLYRRAAALVLARSSDTLPLETGSSDP
ncbi:MAG: A/G-specific adenine glycosylase [Sphingomicrobium sp.]